MPTKKKGLILDFSFIFKTFGIATKSGLVCTRVQSLDMWFRKYIQNKTETPKMLFFYSPSLEHCMLCRNSLHTSISYPTFRTVTQAFLRVCGRMFFTRPTEDQNETRIDFSTEMLTEDAAS